MMVGADIPVVIITGAGSGIGSAVARRLATRGLRVILCDINPVGGQEVADELEAEGRDAIFVQADVTDEACVMDLAGRAARLGAVVGVVACAGAAFTGLVTEMSIETFDRLIAVNLRSVFLLAKHVFPYMSHRGGSFVCIGSDASLNGFQAYGGYCASKHGVAGLIKVLALDHGHEGIRSNLICPGYVETPMLDRLMAELPGERADYERAIPVGRFAKPPEVASLVEFLLSDAASYINGALIPLDGGSTAGPYQAASA